VSIKRAVLLVAGMAAVLVTSLVATQAGRASTRSFPTPIRHVVVVYQENHSFNQVLGLFCKRTGRCPYRTVGLAKDGTQVPLQHASDLIPSEPHGTDAQVTSVDGGLMDGFSSQHNCGASADYRCYQMYGPAQIPSLFALAKRFAISDSTFEMSTVPSWGAHLELVAATLDGFLDPRNPYPSVTGATTGPGWGCDSNRDDDWQRDPSGPVQAVPACVPARDGSGPYRPSPVRWVPTIMDRLAAAGMRWHIYANGPGQGNYGWSICPTFADCLDTPQHRNVVPTSAVIHDARSGTLPRLALVIPSYGDSQHNGTSMLQGDDWIGKVLDAVMRGPQWGSTAVFITYDDYGGFYDWVAPPAGLGIRVPMVIVSPYARPGYTDPTTASFDSILAFTERVYRLAPLGTADANAYDFRRAFNFRQKPLAPIRLTPKPIPGWERRWIRDQASRFMKEST
jgi:phospholipase C